MFFNSKIEKSNQFALIDIAHNIGIIFIFSIMKIGLRIPNSSLGKLSNLPYGKIIACLAVVAFMIMMLVKPSFYLNSARRGLSLYATSVLPSLFPFYFFSLLLTYIGSAKAVSSIFQKPVKLLYNAPKESAYVLLLSMLSGYPVGASMTAELYTAGVITSKEAKSIAAFASTSGPIFMLGTIGSAIFNDARVGIIVLCAHYLSALLNGLIFRVSSKPNRILRKKQHTDNVKIETNVEPLNNITIMSQQDVDNVMSRTIANSTLSMLYIGGYVVLCGMLVDTLSLLNISSLIITALGERTGQPIVALIEGLIEMTRGSIACSKCSSVNIGVALCAAIVSFGGLSIMLQNYTFLSKCQMRFSEIAVRKIFQSVIAFVVAFALSFAVKNW